MLAGEDDEPVDAGVVAAPDRAAADAVFTETLRLVTVNVAGCREYTATTDAARMDKILDSLLERDPQWTVDALLLQEVLMQPKSERDKRGSEMRLGEGLGDGLGDGL